METLEPSTAPALRPGALALASPKGLIEILIARRFSSPGPDLTPTILSPASVKPGEAAAGRGGWAERSVRAVLAAILLALALLWPAAWNGAPILFSDSASYLRSGEAALEAVARLSEPGGGGPRPGDLRGYGISTQRSVYYGAPFIRTLELGGPWLPALLQALLVSVTLLVGLRRLGLAGLASRAGVAAVLVPVSGVAIFASTLMPDVLAGTMVLSMALLLAYAGRFPRGEWTWLFLMVVLGALVHRSNLALAMVLLVAATPVLALCRVNWPRTVLALAAALALCGAAHSAVDQVIRKITGYPPVPLPFLLARVIGDGTAQPYLERRCAAERFFSCKFLRKMPMTENEFLWSWDPKRIAFAGERYEGRARIDAEESRIVMGVVRDDPVRQLIASSGNAVQQFFDVGATEFRRQVPVSRRISPPIHRLLVDYQRTELAHGRIPMIELSWLMLGVYLVSLAVGVGVLARRWPGVWAGLRRNSGPEDELRFWAAFVIMLKGLAINAAVSGVLAGVFDRYQGRVAWLAALFALVALARWGPMRRASRPG
jgi:hypothetical protein